MNGNPKICDQILLSLVGAAYCVHQRKCRKVSMYVVLCFVCCYKQWAKTHCEVVAPSENTRDNEALSHNDQQDGKVNRSNS